MIEQEELLSLIKSAQNGDEAAKTRILTENSPLIKSVIRRFRNKGVEYEDLYQLGSIGFLKAIKNFAPEFGVKFSTYAVPMIAGEVKRFFARRRIYKGFPLDKISCGKDSILYSVL